jgi:hypothetical protein
MACNVDNLGVIFAEPLIAASRAAKIMRIDFRLRLVYSFSAPIAGNLSAVLHKKPVAFL